MAENSSMQDFDFYLADMFASLQTIALVGASDNWKRPSYFVMKYLLKNGYRVIPVNPKNAGSKILGEHCYATLEDIPDSVDMVDVFRASEYCAEIAKSAVKIGAKILWLQIGVENSDAKKIAQQSNMKFIENLCIKIEHSRLSGQLGILGFNTGFISARRAEINKPPPPKRNGGIFKTNHSETLAIHAGTRPDPATGARSMPIYQTTAFTFDDTEHAASLFNLQEPGNIYGRLSNPTTAALEQRLAALDKALGACCTASGHAAQIMALYPIMQPGRKIIASNRLYGGTITQFTRTIKNFSWQAELVDVTDKQAVIDAVADPSVAVLFAESLANPDGNITDIEMLAAIAKDAGIPLIIDNTMATPILCRPGDYGADIIIYSTTKFLSGHGNAMGGAIVDRGSFPWLGGRGYPALAEPDGAYHGIRFAETFGALGYITYCHASVMRDFGATMAPMNAYLTLLGLETLPCECTNIWIMPRAWQSFSQGMQK